MTIPGKIFTPGTIGVFVFTALYSIAFAVYFIVSHNSEFLIYVGVFDLIVAAVAATLRFSKLPSWALWCLSVLGLLHLAGGGVHVNGDVLYNYVMIPIINHGENGITLWRFDQLVHPYGAAVAGFIVYYFMKRSTLTPLHIAVFVVLAAMGIGALNEVVEFITTILIPHTDVGGYNNTALDLCSNTVGGSIAGIGSYFLAKRRKSLS